MPRRKKERRSGGERRSRTEAVPAERRQGGDRRSGNDRRLSLETAGNQIQGAIDLVARAAQSNLLVEDDRWLLDTAIHRLQAALRQLDEGETS